MARTDPTTITPDKLGHRSRYSDSSFYDEVCVLCGANDGDGSFSKVCSAPLVPEDIALVEVRITKTIERLVLIRAVDVEAYRAAFEKDAAHMTRNTPPELPAYATVVETTRTAESIQTVRTLA